MKNADASVLKKAAVALPLVLLLTIIIAFTATRFQNAPQKTVVGERLFFSLRIESQGRLVAKPNLLGQSGRRITMKLVDPENAERTNLALEMLPVASKTEANGYDVFLSLLLPDLSQTPDKVTLHLFHGEEKRFLLTQGPYPVTVTVTLMRVNSPEFEIWKELVEQETAAKAT